MFLGGPFDSGEGQPRWGFGSQGMVLYGFCWASKPSFAIRGVSERGAVALVDGGRFGFWGDSGCRKGVGGGIDDAETFIE